jgi:Skp family chaperone for outer membrane proteins
MMIASVLGALLTAGTAAAQTPQTPAPATPPAPAAAQTPPATPAPFPADAKVAFVDPQIVLSNSVAGKAGMTELQQLIEKKQAEIQAKNTEIQKLNQEIQANQSVWSSTVSAQKQAELTRQQNELQYLQTQAQTETDALEQQMVTQFQDKVIPIIETMRAEKGLWMILTNAQGSIVALDPRIDLSMEVVKRLDAAQ